MVYSENAAADVLLPVGGGDEVGASAFMLSFGGRRFLLDAGRRFGSSRLYPKFDAACAALGMDGLWELDAVLISHAHADHVGSLGKVAQDAPNVPIYATGATLTLAEAALEDSLRRADYSKNDDSEMSLVSRVERTLSGARPVEFGRAFCIGDVSVRFLRAGHIPGAAMIHMQHAGHSLLYTGDFCDFDLLVARGCSLPDGLEADTIITEATYEGRDESESLVKRRAKVLGALEDALEKFPNAVVSAEPNGKAQEAALLISRWMDAGLLPESPIYITGAAGRIASLYDRCGIALPAGIVCRKECRSLPGETGVFIVGGRELNSLKEQLSKEAAVISAECLPTHAGRSAILEMTDLLRPSRVILVHRAGKGGDEDGLCDEFAERHLDCISVEPAYNGKLIDLKIQAY